MIKREKARCRGTIGKHQGVPVKKGREKYYRGDCRGRAPPQGSIAAGKANIVQMGKTWKRGANALQCRKKFLAFRLVKKKDENEKKPGF